MKHVIICLVGLFISACEYRPYNMASNAMSPTLPKDSLFLVDKGAYNVNSPERFDIVAFTPTEPYLQITWVFRVIGLPGESIEIKDSGVLINNEKVTPPNGLQYLPLDAPYTKLSLKKGEYYLVGDNTKNANDSRYLGAIKRQMISGKVTKRLK